MFKDDFVYSPSSFAERINNIYRHLIDRKNEPLKAITLRRSNEIGLEKETIADFTKRVRSNDR